MGVQPTIQQCNLCTSMLQTARPPPLLLQKTFVAAVSSLGYRHVDALKQEVASGVRRALLLARTEMVLVLDGDMLAHAGLHRSLANNQQRCADGG